MKDLSCKETAVKHINFISNKLIRVKLPPRRDNEDDVLSVSSSSSLSDHITKLTFRALVLHQTSSS